MTMTSSASMAVAMRTRHFSSRSGGPSASKSSASVTKGSSSAVGAILFLLGIMSDPVISALEEAIIGEDENESYWMMDRRYHHRSKCKNDEEVRAAKLSRLRNARKHYHFPDSGNEGDANNDGAHDNNITNLPDYSRIVIVGGGMAGLHTALALAERMSSDPRSNQDDADGPPTARNSREAQSSSNINGAKEIIILDASRIGEGASGRAKGLVVPGFQVPLENLRENASDSDENKGRWTTVPGIVQSLSNALGMNKDPEQSPGYTKAVAEEMYDLSYGAMDRLRNIVKTYKIDCGWVESGALEGSIHPMEEEDEDEDEDDGCEMLTSSQVNEIMGRPTGDGSSDRNLYKRGEYDPSCAGVNPLALTVGLADAAERWGVKIFEHTKVASLEKAPFAARPRQNNMQERSMGKYKIETDQGQILRCDHVVLCTGAESLSNKVSRRLSGSFVPVYTWMAATEPLHERCPLKSGVVDEVLSESSGESSTGSSDRERPAPMCGDDHISLNYWRNNNKDEGRILFGSLADTYSLPKWFISWRLRSALTEIYPQLSNVRFDHVWGGKLAFALNSMPLIGRDTDYDDTTDDANANEMETNKVALTEGGVWYATGFAGHGIVPTALAGSLLANAILGVPNQQQWQLFQTYFPPSSWNGYPCSRMGSGMVLLLYNTWDWLGKKGVPVPPLPKLW